MSASVSSWLLFADKLGKERLRPPAWAPRLSGPPVSLHRRGS